MNVKEKVNEWIDNNQNEVIELLQELIRKPSVNAYFDEEEQYKGEGKAQQCLREYLDEMGMKTEFQYPDAEELKEYEGKPGYYADHKFENRPNLVGTLKGEGGGRSILLSGHIDVVQRGGDWTMDPFGGELKDGKIYGRGAVDMKGGIAAMTVAVKAIQKAGFKLKGDVKIGTVVDEEAGGMGSLAMIAAGNRADACVISEPTNLKIAPLCRGILWGKLIIEARAGHIELKQGDWRTGGAVDGIAKGRMYLKAFENRNKDWAVGKRHKYMSIPCQINIAEFHAGEYPTTFANHCEITFDAQYLSSAAGHTVCIRRDHLFHGLPVAGCHRLFHEMLQIVPLHKRRHASASPRHILCRTGAEGDAAACVCRVQLLSEFFLPADMVSRLYGTGVLIYFFLSGFIGYYIRPDTEPFRPLIGIF